MIFISQDLYTKHLKSIEHVHDIRATDHAALVQLTLTPSNTKDGKGYWICPKWILDMDDTKQMIELHLLESLDQMKLEQNVGVFFDNKLRNLRKKLRQIHRAEMTKSKDAIFEPVRQLQRCQLQYSKDKSQENFDLVTAAREHCAAQHVIRTTDARQKRMEKQVNTGPTNRQTPPPHICCLQEKQKPPRPCQHWLSTLHNPKWNRQWAHKTLARHLRQTTKNGRPHELHEWYPMATVG